MKITNLRRISWELFGHGYSVSKDVANKTKIFKLGKTPMNNGQSFRHSCAMRLKSFLHNFQSPLSKYPLGSAWLGRKAKVKGSLIILFPFCTKPSDKLTGSESEAKKETHRQRSKYAFSDSKSRKRHQSIFSANIPLLLEAKVSKTRHQRNIWRKFEIRRGFGEEEKIFLEMW